MRIRALLLSVALVALYGTAAAGEEPPAGLSHADWSQIRTAIDDASYRVEPLRRNGESSELMASNREQGYLTTFRYEGIEIAAGRRREVSWRLALALTGYGYEGKLHPLGHVEPVTVNDRVEYRRGPVTEWYVNRPGGLEQGFTIAEPEPRASGPIVLAMAVEGDLEARVEEEVAASFRDGAGQTRVRYAGLVAWDADGRPLASRLEAAEGELRVLVEAAGARFPVTVDPVFVQEAKLEGHGDPIGSAGENAGASVSVSGDTAVIGARYADTAGGLEAGAAYVFVRSGTLWVEQQKLLASDGAASDYFGACVSVSGDTAVIGALSADTAGGVDAGAAYVFVRSGAAWSEEQRLVAADGASGDNFGFSVAASGDTVVVGAPSDDTAGGVNAGSAYVFVRSGTLWTERQKLVAADGAAVDYLGWSVSVSGDTAVVGAYRADTVSGLNAGAAYVFVRWGTPWTQQQKLLASGAAANNYFGWSVSVSGDTAVIGAYGYASNVGSAYAFVRSGTLWSEQQTLLASDGAANDYFGWSVSVSGDTALVGAPVSDTAGGTDMGAAYVFVRSGTVWSEQQKLAAPDGAAIDYFGGSVSVSADTAVAGAFYDDTTGGVDAGSAYVFVRSGTVWSEQRKLVATSGTPAGVFGRSVSISGDTVAIGALNNGTAAGGGAAYVFVRSGTVWNEQQRVVGVPQGFFGWSVSVSGDTLVVGAPLHAVGGESVGSAYVFVRSGSTWNIQQELLGSVPFPGGGFGHSVSVSMDTVVIGAPPWVSGAGYLGKAYVFVRSGNTWSEQQRFDPILHTGDQQFGRSVAISGDTAVIGAPGQYLPGTNPGSAHVFVRSGTVWSVQQDLTASDGSPGDFFGESVSMSGETVLVGAPFDETAAGPEAGSAYVFFRSGTVWSEQQKLVAPDGATNDYFGASVSVSGDTAVAGAVSDDTTGGVDAGSAYVFVRSGTVWSEQQKLVASDGAVADLFGYSVSASGDMAVVGAYGDDTSGGSNAGSAHAFRGLTATDAGVTKTDGQASAVPGTSLAYTLTVTDAGPDPGVGVRVVDVPPATLSNVSWTCAASPGSSCPTSGTGTIDHTVNVDVGGSLTYTLTGTVSPSATGSLVNTVSVTPPTGVADPVPANDSATDTDVLIPEADLALSLSDSSDPIAPGNALTYTLQATNLGPSDSSGAMVTDALPGVLTLVFSSPGCTTAGGTVTCALGGSAPNSNQTITLQAIVNPGTVGSFGNTASLVGNDTDPVGNNDTATELTQVSLRELGHGTALSANLRAAGGILADQDIYRIGQQPYSSYEVVLDATSADIGSGQGPDLERLASDASTVLQSSQVAGAGASRTLRWENDSGASVLDQYVRVRSAGCTTACTPEDVYRVRAWDTTLIGPRFNNSGTQLTVLVLQNSTEAPVNGHVHFWSGSGALAGTQAVSLAPRASLALNTSTVVGVAGQSGSLTLSHDGRYGTLLGKAVSIESATGFSFDTPLLGRAR